MVPRVSSTRIGNTLSLFRFSSGVGLRYYATPGRVKSWLLLCRGAEDGIGAVFKGSGAELPPTKANT